MFVWLWFRCAAVETLQCCFLVDTHAHNSRIKLPPRERERASECNEMMRWWTWPTLLRKLMIPLFHFSQFAPIPSLHSSSHAADGALVFASQRYSNFHAICNKQTETTLLDIKDPTALNLSLGLDRIWVFRRILDVSTWLHAKSYSSPFTLKHEMCIS